MKFIRRYFISGSLVVLPIVITIFLFLWAFNFLDGILGSYIDNYLLSHYGFSIPGLGIVFVLALILLVGFLTSHIINRRILSFFENFFIKFPVIKQIYPAVKQIISFLFSEKKISFKKVVMIEYPRKGVYSLGFLTNECFRMFNDTAGRDLVNVFLPSTPSPFTGFLILAPKDEVKIVDIGVEEALKMIISGGVVNPSQIGTGPLPF